MPILTLQRRARELGRIRIGQVVKTERGKSRPVKLDRFRLTSPSRDLLQRVATLYGGTVDEWTPAGGGPPQWEVVTTSTRLPVLVPPQPVTQYFELWAGGGCQRRCDGETELLTDAPCVCSPDPVERECKPTTRLNVLLRDVEGMGVWRLESHGYYAAVELPAVAEFLARANGYIAAWLILEERVVRRDGKTRRFMVPALEVDITPAQVMAGEIGGGPRAVAAPSVAALPAAPVRLDPDSVAAAITVAATVDDLRELWADAANIMTPELEAAFQARAAELARPAAALESGELPDADDMWQLILAAVPKDWESARIEVHFEEVTGVDAVKATGHDMSRYLDYWAQENRLRDGEPGTTESAGGA